MKVIFSTRNLSKARQVIDLFAGSSISITTLDGAEIEGEAVEDGTTLEENAMKKAQFAHERARKGFRAWSMGDDTGLFINALGGEPGIYSARWAGKEADDREIMQYCLLRMQGIKDRSAIFRTVVAVVSFSGKEYVFTGEAHGHLLEYPRADPLPKRPYSGLFVPKGQDLCLAEMTTEYEKTLSHRGRAFQKVRTFLEGLQV